MRAKDLTPKRQVIILKVDGKPLIKSTDQQKILDFQKFLKQKDPNLKIEVIQQPEYFEEEKKALDILDTEISALIKKISNSEAQRRTARAPRYLVYGEYVGSALETNSFFVALAKAKEVAQKGGLDSPVVVYDRKTNFPVVSYLGAEDMWYKTDTSSRKAVNEKWTKKYKKSINCSNPKGFSQKAHCAGRKARQAGKHTKSKKVNENNIKNEILNEGMLQKLAGFALGSILALGPKIGQAETVFSYLNPTTNRMENVLDMSKIPPTARVVMAVDTDTNQVMILKGGVKGQQVQPDPAAIKQAQQPQQSQQVSQDSKLFNQFYVGMPEQEIQKLFAKSKIQQQKGGNTKGGTNTLLSLGLIQPDNTFLQAKITSPQGIPSDAYFIFQNGQLQNIHFISKFKDMGYKIKPQTVNWPYNALENEYLSSQEMINLLKDIASKNTGVLGSPTSTIKKEKLNFEPTYLGAIGAGLMLSDPKDVYAPIEDWRVTFSNGDLNLITKTPDEGKHWTPTEVIVSLGKTIQPDMSLQNQKVNEYGEVDSKRKIEFNKQNPPPFDHLYQQFIQTMLSPNNEIQPQVWIDNVNKLYGLNYKYKDYQNRGHRDYTNNWDKVVNRYVLNKKA